MTPYLAPDNRRWYDTGWYNGVRVGILIGLGIGLLITIIPVWR